jgi:hypothetical protein
MNKLFIKGITYTFVFTLLGVAGYYACIKMNLLSNPFDQKKAYILDTPTIVKEVRSIAELYSVCYYDQIIADSIRQEIKTSDAVINFFGGNSTTDTKLVLLATAKIYAGYDLSKLDSTDISAKDSTLTIRLPAPQIIDVVMNPSDVSTFIEEGTWSMDEVAMVKNKALLLFRKRALEKGIIAEAERKGKESIELFFTSLGFKKVIIENK